MALAFKYHRPAGGMVLTVESGDAEGWPLGLFPGLQVCIRTGVFCCMWVRIHPQTPYTCFLCGRSWAVCSVALWIEAAWVFLQNHLIFLESCSKKGLITWRMLSQSWLYRGCRNDYVPSCLRDLVMALKLIRIKTRQTAAFKAVYAKDHSLLSYTPSRQTNSPLPMYSFLSLIFVSWSAHLLLGSPFACPGIFKHPGPCEDGLSIFWDLGDWPVTGAFNVCLYSCPLKQISPTTKIQSA